MTRRFNWQGFIMANLSVVFLLVFAYIPMGGIIIAFKNMDYSINIMQDLLAKPFIGFEKFIEFFRDRQFLDIMFNTLGLNILGLLFGFPCPIILALMMNEVRKNSLRKFVQTFTCFPHFVSWAIFGAIVLNVISADGGVLNELLMRIGLVQKPVSFATKPQYFWAISIISGQLKDVGWNAIIYLAAIASIDPAIYESAEIDGANRGQRAIHITLPSISSTITVLLLFTVSNILNASFEKMYILQNTLNISRSEVLTTFIYKMGIAQRKYSYTAAVGMFSSVVAFVLLITSHFMSKRISGHGLY